MFTQKRKFKPRRCPHVRLQGIYGDAILASGGRRLQCVDCWRFLDGPVSLSWVDRDPNSDMKYIEELYMGHREQ